MCIKASGRFSCLHPTEGVMLGGCTKRGPTQPAIREQISMLRKPCCGVRMRPTWLQVPFAAQQKYRTKSSGGLQKRQQRKTANERTKTPNREHHSQDRMSYHLCRKVEVKKKGWLWNRSPLGQWKRVHRQRSRDTEAWLEVS